MKITKYWQSCILIQTDKNILIDLGNVNYNDEILNKIPKLDIILISHKHNDHCMAEAINKLVARDGCQVYSSREVDNAFAELSVNQVVPENEIKIGQTIINIVEAQHGYLPPMKGRTVKENIGFIINYKNKTVYFTSDTIGFENNYKADIMIMPFSDNGITFGVYDGVEYAKSCGARIIIPVHFEHKLFKTDTDYLRKKCKEDNVELIVLEFGQSKNF